MRETDDEFDDGGTRAWRNNQATWAVQRPRVIDVGRRSWRNMAKSWIKRTPIWRLISWTVAICFLLPWMILFVPIIVMALLGINPG